MSEILPLLTLLISALISTYLGFRARDSVKTHKSELYVVALGTLSVAIAALATLTLDPEGSDSGTLLRMLQNLAGYAAVPMLVSALLAISFQKEISMAGWGRWLLGLFALYELLRRMGQGEGYTQILMLALLGTLAICLFRLKGAQLKAGLTAVLLCAAGSAAAYFDSQIGLSLWLLSASLVGLSYTLPRLAAKLRQ